MRDIGGVQEEKPDGFLTYLGNDYRKVYRAYFHCPLHVGSFNSFGPAPVC